jgi:hypothetical protein
MVSKEFRPRSAPIAITNVALQRPNPIVINRQGVTSAGGTTCNTPMMSARNGCGAFVQFSSER